jgi:hypothetical protein
MSSFPCRADFIFHTAAHIKDETHRRRNIFIGKRGNLLRRSVLENFEVIAAEPQGGSTRPIRNRNWDENEIHIYRD